MFLRADSDSSSRDTVTKDEEHYKEIEVESLTAYFLIYINAISNFTFSTAPRHSAEI